MILVNKFLEKENLDKNRSRLVINDLQFYKKRLIYCANVF